MEKGRRDEGGADEGLTFIRVEEGGFGNLMNPFVRSMDYARCTDLL